MDVFQAIIIALVEGITEYIPVSSTGHMIFVSSYFNIQNEDFTKLFQVAIQFGAILAVVFLYWRKFLNFSKISFFIKLAIGVIPALALGVMFDDAIDSVLGKPIPIAVALILGGIVLLFIDRFFNHPQVAAEEQITNRQAFFIGLWQCLAMMPGTSRSAASIIGGMQQKLSRETAAEFSFFLAVPTMLAVSVYAVFFKNYQGGEKGYELLFNHDGHLQLFILGNIIAFIVAVFAIKFFIGFIKKYGFKPWGYYRILVGLILLLYFSFNP